LVQWATRFKQQKEAKLKTAENELAASVAKSKLLQAICTMPHTVIVTVSYGADLSDISKAQQRTSETWSQFPPLFRVYLGVKPSTSEITTNGYKQQVRWLECTLYTEALPLNPEVSSAAAMIKEVTLKCDLQARWWPQGKDRPVKLTEPLHSTFQLTLQQLEAKKTLPLTIFNSKLRYAEYIGEEAYPRESGMSLEEIRNAFRRFRDTMPEFVCTVAAQVVF
jgi:hypothetical protein